MGIPKTAAELVNSGRMLVAAHRGDCLVAPENTLPAFESALALGVDLVEFDYHHSADGVPVVIHDVELDRTTNAATISGRSHQKIADWTRAQLSQLDAGEWFDVRFRGARVPSLREALEAICPTAIALPEQKAGDAATCIELLKESGWLDRVVVQSFDWRFLAQCHGLAPELVLAALGEGELTEDKLDGAIASGARIIAWDNRTLTAGEIAAIHRRGCKAWVWTADEPARIAELLASGIDAIITNRPAQLQALLAAPP